MTTIKRIELGDAGFAGLTAVVNKLNRRAEKHGMDKLVVKVVSTKTVRNEETGVDHNRYDVEINGCAPCINGWYLAAVISNNEIIGTMVKTVPGKFDGCDYSKYRDHDFSCDHCNTKRRRNDVFVLANDKCQFKVVGRSCLADFLRCKDAAGFAEYAEMFDKLSSISSGDFDDIGYEEGFGERGSGAAVALRTFIAVSRVCETKLGWTSRGDAFDNPGCKATADDALSVIFGRGYHNEEFIKDNDLFTRDSDYDYADKVIAWVTTLTDTTNEYMDTIAKIGHAGVVDYKLAGYAASIGRAYEREQARETVVKQEKDYIGDADKKGAQELGVVTIVRTHFLDGDYGVRTVVAMEAKLADGKVAPITWFATGEKTFEEGDEYTLRASIKGHEESEKWGRQTIVTRAKLSKVA